MLRQQRADQTHVCHLRIKGLALLGLKENVIIGKLIPAGTGMPRYRTIKLATEGLS